MVPPSPPVFAGDPEFQPIANLGSLGVPTSFSGSAACRQSVRFLLCEPSTSEFVTVDRPEVDWLPLALPYVGGIHELHHRPNSSRAFSALFQHAAVPIELVPIG
jgi:hypothetical protein